jgi:hypothetical protein
MGSDFDQFWMAARAVRANCDVYTCVGPGARFPFPWAFFYPLPAAMLAVPFSNVSVDVARAIFAALCGFVYTMALTYDGSYHRTPALMSWSLIEALQHGQLSPLLAAALVYPWLGGVMAAIKPSVGAALLAAQPSRFWLAFSLCVGVFLCAMASMIDYQWFPKWWTLARQNLYTIPMVMRLGGVLLLLAWLKWRMPNGRFLGTLALVPITSPMYESVTLYFIPQTFRRSLILALLSHASKWVELATTQFPRGTMAEWINTSAVCAVLIIYIPALVMLLRDAVHSDRA